MGVLLLYFLTSAASEHGLKIMAMLYLTPVLPLGLVSYMCGTTSMDIFSFAVAKIASLPLYLIYTFMGASAHSFIKRGGQKSADDAAGNGAGDEPQQPMAFSAEEEARQLEENEALIVAGIVLSVFMMTCITRYIKKELMKVGRLLSGARPARGTGEMRADSRTPFSVCDCSRSSSGPESLPK